VSNHKQFPRVKKKDGGGASPAQYTYPYMHGEKPPNANATHETDESGKAIS
jgi:hypothetical protein